MLSPVHERYTRRQVPWRGEGKTRLLLFVVQNAADGSLSHESSYRVNVMVEKTNRANGMLSFFGARILRTLAPFRPRDNLVRKTSIKARGE